VSTTAGVGCLRIDAAEKVAAGRSLGQSGGIYLCQQERGVEAEARAHSVLDFSFGRFSESLPVLFAEDEYPSAYHPPPASLKLQGDMIFFAFLLHLGHLMASVPIGTRLSVIVPSGH